MRHDLVVSKSVSINASATHLWRVLTIPSLIREYLYDTETTTDWQVGSPVSFQGTYQGQTYRDKGVVIANVPANLLSYRYWSGFSGLADLPENYVLVTYSLAAVHSQQTTLTWTQQGFATEEGYQHSEQGLAAFLQQIKHLAER
ncbi:MAG: SRPBCC family protein [Janthinobacterium lividum]